jgi:nucleoside-diphosphate-sugar epimerase
LWGLFLFHLFGYSIRCRVALRHVMEDADVDAVVHLAALKPAGLSLDQPWSIMRTLSMAPWFDAESRYEGASLGR